MNTLNKPIKSAFTLVELLVVIAIISILAALLLPVLEDAVTQAQVISCKNQQHQVYTTIVAYTGEFNDMLPDAPGAAGRTDGLFRYSSGPLTPTGYLTGMGKLVPFYLDDRIELFSCPSRNSLNMGQWKSIVATNYRAGTWSTWTAQPIYASHYGCGWNYGKGWSTGTWNFWPGIFSSSTSFNPRNQKPTPDNYARSGRKVLVADSNALWSDGYNKASFHNNGEYQNTLMVDGSCGTILDYWSTLRPFMNYCWSYSNGYYWYVGSPGFCWWLCFGEGEYSN